MTGVQTCALPIWLIGSLEFYLTPWGFLKGAADNNATMSRRKVKGHTVLTWSPAVKSPSGHSYVINGFVDENNIVDRVETWVGDNIMGDMHIEATYTGWKDFGGAMAPAKIATATMRATHSAPATTTTLWVTRRTWRLHRSRCGATTVVPSTPSDLTSTGEH